MGSAFLLLPIMSGVMWGAAGVFVRTLTDYGMSGTTIVFARVAIATVMMLALILVTDRKMLRIRGKDLWMFLVCAVSMLGLNVFYTVSVNEVSLSLAAVLLSLSPVFMLLMARAVFGERITRKKLVCIVVCIVGCVLVSGLLERGSTLSVVGIASGLAAAFFYALYGLTSKRAAAEGYSTYTTLLYCMLISSVVLIPFADIGQVAEYSSNGWNLAYLVLQAAVASFLPYIFYTTAMARIEAGTASILAACGEPMAAAMFGLLFFTEIPTPLMLVGMALAIGSMALMCMPSKRAEAAAS